MIKKADEPIGGGGSGGSNPLGRISRKNIGLFIVAVAVIAVLAAVFA